MEHRRHSARFAFAVAALALCTCSRSAESGAKILRWWHVNSDEPAQKVLNEIAEEFEASHPGVDVRVTALENMEYKPKLSLEFSSGSPPELFHSWGGGGMAEQVEAGYLRDISAWINSPTWKGRASRIALDLYSYKGKNYGFPQDLGAVGFWYNEDLLAKVGYKAFPERWEGLIELCAALKKAGITPIALGFADRWPVMFYWVYLSLRLGGPGLFDDILAGRRGFDDPAVLRGGAMMRELYLKGFFPDTAIGDDFPSQSRLMGDGKAAMQLMGQWALAVQAQSSDGGAALSGLMRFAPFPAVQGGKGSTGDAMGGGNGFVVGAGAPDEAIELLEYFARPENLARYFAAFPAVPTVDGVPIEAPGLRYVKDYLGSASSFCLYPDQLFPLEIGTLLNETSARVMLGEISPEEGCSLLQASWAAHRAGASPSP
jgi:raffinose/stachyose/melibiose transport system substrate-binding protein